MDPCTSPIPTKNLQPTRTNEADSTGYVISCLAFSVATRQGEGTCLGRRGETVRLGEIPSFPGEMVRRGRTDLERRLFLGSLLPVGRLAVVEDRLVEVEFVDAVGVHLHLAEVHLDGVVDGGVVRRERKREAEGAGPRKGFGEEAVSAVISPRTKRHSTMREWNSTRMGFPRIRRNLLLCEVE